MIEVAEYERFLLCARPALELSFAHASVGKRPKELDAENEGGWIDVSGSACLTGGVVFKPLLKVFRGTNVDRTRMQTQKVDDWCPLRRGPSAVV